MSNRIEKHNAKERLTMEKKITNSLNKLSRIVCTIGIFITVFISIALFVVAGDNNSVLNYITQGRSSGSLLIIGIVVLVLGIVNSLLIYYLIRGFAVIVSNYEEPEEIIDSVDYVSDNFEDEAKHFMEQYDREHPSEQK